MERTKRFSYKPKRNSGVKFTPLLFFAQNYVLLCKTLLFREIMIHC